MMELVRDKVFQRIAGLESSPVQSTVSRFFDGVKESTSEQGRGMRDALLRKIRRGFHHLKTVTPDLDSHVRTVYGNQEGAAKVWRSFSSDSVDPVLGCVTPDRNRAVALLDRPMACQERLHRVDEAVRRAGVTDASSFPVPGFPYLRTNRFLILMKDRSSTSSAIIRSSSSSVIASSLPGSVGSRRVSLQGPPPCSSSYFCLSSLSALRKEMILTALPRAV
jgi:hypothetical protein